MSTFKCLAVFVVSLGLLFGGSRPVSAQGGHVEESSLARRMFQIVRVSRYVQPRAQAMYRCQVSSLPVGVSAPVVILQHAPVVNLSCGWNDKDNTAYRYSSSGKNIGSTSPQFPLSSMVGLSYLTKLITSVVLGSMTLRPSEFSSIGLDV
jgi:hypothetical protein